MLLSSADGGHVYDLVAPSAIGQGNSGICLPPSTCFFTISYIFLRAFSSALFLALLATPSIVPSALFFMTLPIFPTFGNCAFAVEANTNIMAAAMNNLTTVLHVFISV